MNTLNRKICCLVLLAAGSALAPVFAADTVYQRSGNTQSIELSNIDDADAAQVPLVVDSKPARASIPVAKQAIVDAVPKPQRSKRGALARTEETPANSLEEEELAESSPIEKLAENVKDKVNALPEVAEPTLGNDNSGSSNTSYASAGTTVGQSISTTADSTPPTTAAPATTPTTAPSPTTTNPRTDTAGSSAVSTAGLSTSLQQYRQLMLQDAADPNLLLGNPSLSRRYLMVDRNTYQTRVGQ
jgi:hypothetical protein